MLTIQKPNNQVVIAPSKENPQKRSAAAISVGAAIGTLPCAYLFKDSITVDSDKKLKMITESMLKISPDIDTFENIKDYAAKALKDSGLEAKGVKIKYVNSSNAAEVADEIVSSAKNAPFVERIAKKFSKMFEYGANAAFNPSNNTIYTGEKAGYSNIFHEIGHSLNRNSSVLMKSMQKASGMLTPYGVPIAGLALFLASLFHRAKPETADKPKSLWEKTKDFVKQNAGKLTLVTFAPMLIEEAIASVKGIKIAKKYLNPSQIAKLSKNYRSNFGTYALTALLISGAIGLGNSIAEGIQIKKNEKNK